ncbi:pseudouridine synthase [Spongiibacter sp. KMU-158]|uniref:Pseudouridine synthase n=1 Tax=Spongiibacter pelagi TaxID=2760804 RepID=A0A927GWL7_9GAMM|nr:pseudouridine synthase [Spongiibacter pelagi]MBD2859248.1 pseudouridine synthase [Spongiibacter pelagi]
MSDLILLNKPFKVLSQFRRDGDKSTLADFIDTPAVYPAGRLDYDSEGLLILTGDGALQHSIAHPDRKLAKTYWVQVEGEITSEAIAQLAKGVELKDGLTKPAIAERIAEPKSLWERNPPVRFRAAIPTSWLSLQITEGKNRQVRRMTAAVGFPTLRLIRYAIGPWTIDGIEPGAHQAIRLKPELYRELCQPKARIGQNKHRPSRVKTPRSGANNGRGRGRK